MGWFHSHSGNNWLLFWELMQTRQIYGKKIDIAKDNHKNRFKNYKLD